MLMLIENPIIQNCLLCVTTINQCSVQLSKETWCSFLVFNEILYRYIVINSSHKFSEDDTCTCLRALKNMPTKREYVKNLISVRAFGLWLETLDTLEIFCIFRTGQATK